MATCDIDQLLAEAVANGFDRLTDKQSRAAELQLWYDASGSTETVDQLWASACENGFACLGEHLAMAAALTLLFDVPNSGGNGYQCVNLIPDGAVYGLSGNYVFIISDGVFNVPLTEGNSYVLTWGANETSIHLPAACGYAPYGTIANPGSGSFTFVAGTQTPFFSIQLFGPVGQPITATICEV
jgi:hypothetical protein